ncbi:MAG: hypothetical protein K0R43_2066 [Pseudoduganella sp.]|jgi:uncharacterized iron-regulated protein|nr:hypothetical protein [Pseudoduganella sp.]
MKPISIAALLAALALAACGSKHAVHDAAPAGASLSNPQVLLLGEVHDNKEGHRLRLDELRRRVEAGWRPVIAMEQFDRETQGLLDEAQKGCLDASCLIKVMGGKRWDWQLYHPVIQLALTHQLPLVAANLSRNDASRVVRDGLAASFDAATIAAYKLNEPLPADLRRGQEKAIQEGHCNMVSDLMLPGMVNAQVARDIWMAKLVRAQLPRDVVLIAGNGHVRKDIGVPRWLNAIEPKLNMRAIGFIEPDGVQGSYDEIRKVPVQTRTDPCAKFK